jgi:hypothetical protein
MTLCHVGRRPAKFYSRAGAAAAAARVRYLLTYCHQGFVKADEVNTYLQV